MIVADLDMRKNQRRSVKKKQLKSSYLSKLVKGQLSFMNCAACLDPPLGYVEKNLKLFQK